MADSRSLDDLLPPVRERAERLLEELKEAGLPCTVTFTLRSMAEQARLYAQGRTAPGHIVTDAPAGYSYHNFGCALDVLPECLATLKNWGDNPHDQAHTNEIWEKVGSIGKSLGFRWGGDFAKIKDRPHFEWSGTLSLADLRAGKRPN